MFACLPGLPALTLQPCPCSPLPVLLTTLVLLSSHAASLMWCALTALSLMFMWLDVNMLMVACVQASLKVFQRAGGLAPIRRKSILLTGGTQRHPPPTTHTHALFPHAPHSPALTRSHPLSPSHPHALTLHTLGLTLHLPPAPRLHGGLADRTRAGPEQDPNPDPLRPHAPRLPAQFAGRRWLRGDDHARGV